MAGAGSQLQSEVENTVIGGGRCSHRVTARVSSGWGALEALCAQESEEADMALEAVWATRA